MRRVGSFFCVLLLACHLFWVEAEDDVDAVTLASPVTADITDAKAQPSRKPRDEEIVRAEIGAWIDNHWRLSIATANRLSIPYISAVIYANEGFTIYFRSPRNSQKMINILENPLVSYSIWDKVEEMQDLQVLQMMGRASILEGEERERVGALFQGPPLEKDYAVVAVKPMLALWTDNSIAFGYREMVTFTTKRK